MPVMSLAGKGAFLRCRPKCDGLGSLIPKELFFIDQLLQKNNFVGLAKSRENDIPCFVTYCFITGDFPVYGFLRSHQIWWNMKKNIILSTIGLLLCCLIAPTASFASTTKAKAHHKAVKACEGKKAGDTVEFINKWNKRVMGICTEEKGELIAIRVKE